MLPRALRLTRRGFEQARGLRRVHTAHFSISYGENQASGGSAVVVPKKAVRGAVARHLLKRRMRAALLAYSVPTRILIVSARAGAETLTYKEIEHELSSSLKAILQ